MVLLTDAHYEVVDSLRAHIRKIGIVFFQPVVHLRRLGVLKPVQAVDDKLSVGLKQKRTFFESIQMAFVLRL